MSNRYYVSKNNHDLYDPFMLDFFSYPLFEDNHRKEMMKTDVIDEDDHYLVKVDVPSFKKEDITISLDHGYLVIHAKNESKQEEKKHGKFIRQERYYGSFSRSFYVGENLQEKDIKAKLEDGVLEITLPKEKEEKTEDSKFISIE